MMLIFMLGTVISSSCSSDDESTSENNTNENIDKYPTAINAVDLGLSVKWASCNVGANTPEDFGDYFAWGETTGYLEGKTEFSWNTYKWYGAPTREATTQTHYPYDILDKDDDVAHVKWGGTWRIPTSKEMQELAENCTWTRTTKNGINGFEVSSKVNENSIFLPAAGARVGDAFLNWGSAYWACERSSDVASSYQFDGSGSWRYDGCYLYYGKSVRPVCSK